MEDYDALFEKLVLQETSLQEAFDFVRKRSNGNVWLIGGAVYRNIAHMLYRTEKAPHDFDFIVGSPKPQIALPMDWIQTTNKYGNPKFVSNALEIDFVPLTTVHSIIRRGLEFSFVNYLTGTPLTIQSIGYNLITKKLEGDIGLHAVKTRTVGINNKEQAKIYEVKKGKSISEIIAEKARSLGFCPLW